MAQWPELQPPTLLSNDADRIRDFVEAQPDRSVLKPWDGNGGRGVLVTRKGDGNLRSMIELLTAEGREYIIAQRYVPEVVQGDKRILLFAGEPVGAMLRVPGDGDHRANMHVGATVEPTDLSASDRRICDALAPLLQQWGQVFVGIDVIGEMLTEVNVTSPTGIQEMNRLYDVRLESQLVDTVQSLWQRRVSP